MSPIGEYTSIHALNAGAIIDTLAAALYQARGTESYHLTQIETLTAENAAQAEEIKRLQGELEKGKPEAPAHTFKVGDKVLYKGLVDTIKIHDGGDDTFLLENRNRWVEACDVSPAPSEAPDAALPTV